MKTPEKAVRFSINEKFAEEYDKWDKKTPNFSFNIGTTSEVLQKIGIENKDFKLTPQETMNICGGVIEAHLSDKNTFREEI